MSTGRTASRSSKLLWPRLRRCRWWWRFGHRNRGIVWTTRGQTWMTWQRWHYHILNWKSSQIYIYIYIDREKLSQTKLEWRYEHWLMNQVIKKIKRAFGKHNWKNQLIYGLWQFGKVGNEEDDWENKSLIRDNRMLIKPKIWTCLQC